MQTGKQAVTLTNTLELPEWTRFDLGARYVVAAGETPITFRFNVDNVANKSYWSSSLGGYLVQGLPRTFKASATVEFLPAPPFLPGAPLATAGPFSFSPLPSRCPAPPGL